MIRRIMLTTVLTMGLLVVSGATPGYAQEKTTAADTRDANLRAYTDLMRTDIRAQRVAIITEMMQFTEAEDTAFWPIFREYEGKLSKINDDRLALITQYAEKYETLTDSDADRMAHAALDLEARRQTLKAEYFDKFRSALSPKTAARFLQVENQILLLLDLQIAAALPIVR